MDLKPPSDSITWVSDSLLWSMFVCMFLLFFSENASCRVVCDPRFSFLSVYQYFYCWISLVIMFTTAKSVRIQFRLIPLLCVFGSMDCLGTSIKRHSKSTSRWFHGIFHPVLEWALAYNVFKSLVHRCLSSGVLLNSTRGTVKEKNVEYFRKELRIVNFLKAFSSVSCHFEKIS